MLVEDFIGKNVKYDNYGYFIGEHKNGKQQIIGELIDYKSILELFKYDLNKSNEFQNELGNWICDAINNKLNNK